MSIPPELQVLIKQLNEEINEIEQKATEGLKMLRRVMSQFSENVILVQYFAYLSTIPLFVDTSRRQIKTIIETISPSNVPGGIIQEFGEDLGTLLGKVFEAKIRVMRIYSFLEGLS